MATRDYFAQFGSGNPASVTGLTPTFIVFMSTSGSAGTPPAITEPGAKGLYKFSYDASATMIAFVLDGFTTSLATADRYISGVLDPYDTFGVTLNAIGLTAIAQGVTLVAIGNTAIAQGQTLVAIGNTFTTLAGSIGDTSSAIGSTAIDPTTLFGFLKRAQEVTEGNNTYIKATGVLSLLSRGATLLRNKTISDTLVQTTKT